MATFAKSALITLLTLFGGLALGFAGGNAVFNLLSGGDFTNINPGHIAIAVIPALAGFLMGGALWGAQMGRFAGADNIRRTAVAGTLGFAPITIILALSLNAAEPAVVESLGKGIPIHRIFTLLFVPTAFLIAGVSAWAIGYSLRGASLGWSLSWRVGTAAAMAFLIINLSMESFGWVVGALRAAERATMLVVMAAGNIAAAILGGGLLGWLLKKQHDTEISRYD